MRSEARIRTLAAVGLLGGVSTLVAIIMVGDTYGAPGAAAYRTYELFNRVMAFLIATQACALLAFQRQEHGAMGRGETRLLRIVLIAWAGMVAGTAAEFWLFSDLPYAANNMRSVAFTFFSLSSLIVGVTLLVLGIRFMRDGRVSRYVGLLCLLYLPLDIAVFLTGQSIFLASALYAMGLAALILSNRLRRDSYVEETDRMRAG